MKLDKSLPYATITGHAVACYEQGGMLFDGAGNSIQPKRLQAAEKDRIIESNDVVGAQEFLTHILKSGPLSKSAIFKVAEENNQSWEAVKKAYTVMNIVSYAYGKATMWKLPEDLTT